MKQHRCTFCGSLHPSGYLFGRLTLAICRSCRDVALTYLNHIGVPLTEGHPFVRELCVESHIIESAWWEFYDSINQRKGVVIKGERSSKREGLKRVKSGYPGQADFFMMTQEDVE